MTVRTFIDTNILVYCRDASEPRKQVQAMTWMSHLWDTRIGRLSFQVLQEFYSTVTNKLTPGLDRQIARNDVRSLLSWNPIHIDERIVENAWFIQDRFQFSWWDALIVSAAQVGDCQYILTEDLQEEQVLGNVKVINPFQTSPDSLIPSP